MADASGDEQAARLRAIIAYGDLKLPDAAAVLSVSVRQMSRLTSGEASASTDQLVEQLAVVAGVPAWFARHGFHPPPATASEHVSQRLDAIERRLGRLESR